jgi:hypothetical protein
MTATATAPTTFRTANAGQVTRALKAAGFVKADRAGTDGFRTEAATRSIGGTRVPLVYVREESGHPVKMLRDVVAVARGAFDHDRAVTALRAAGFDAETGTDDRGRSAVAVYSPAARAALVALESRVANAATLAAEWITEGMWTVETDSFPEHSRTVRVGGYESVRDVVAHVLRSRESHREAAPLWFKGMTPASVVLWVDMRDFRGTMRITPATV